MHTGNIKSTPAWSHSEWSGTYLAGVLGAKDGTEQAAAQRFNATKIAQSSLTNTCWPWFIVQGMKQSLALRESSFFMCLCTCYKSYKEINHVRHAACFHTELQIPVCMESVRSAHKSTSQAQQTHKSTSQAHKSTSQAQQTHFPHHHQAT